MSAAIQLHPGLPIMTPQGEGIVMSVRHDGMVVTKLPVLGGGKGPGGAASFFIGFFHPSVVQVVSSGPSIVTTPSSPVGLFGHVSPADIQSVRASGRPRLGVPGKRLHLKGGRKRRMWRPAREEAGRERGESGDDPVCRQPGAPRRAPSLMRCDFSS